MSEPHSWQACRPALLRLAGSGPPPAAAADALEMAWSLVPDDDRKLFHGFCCLSIHDDAHLAAMKRIAALLGAESR